MTEKRLGNMPRFLFKKDRFKLLDSGNYWLSETQDKPSFWLGCAMPEGLFLGEVEG